MGVYSSTAANAYADKIKAVYEYLGEIRKVADRLTPVEDLTSFQTQIEALYAQLDILVEASNIIVNATPTGEAILTGSVASIQELLNIGVLPDDLITQAQLDAALAALQGYLLGQIGNAGDQLSVINITLTELETYQVYQQSQINGLQINYFNVAAGLETNQTNTESALSRLTIREEYATLQDQRLDAINESLVSTATGLQATNDIVSGHTASIESNYNSISMHTASIDQLASTLTDLDSGITANATALSLMETAIVSLGEDITVQSSATLALKSVIGGSGNLLPNADFAAGANGWNIVVAESDWADTVLTTNLFGMPEDVNCLEVLGTPTPLGQIVVESPPILVAGDGYYIVSGYPCVDNGVVELSYKAFDNLNNVVSQGVCPATFNNTTSLNFSSYTRSWVKFQVSPDTVKLRLYLTVTGDGDWIVQGALFRPMVEKAWIDQAGPSEWTPNVTGVPEALAEALQTLTTETSLINGELSALSTAQTSLAARVGTTESALINEMITSANKDAALVSSINTLTTQLTDLETLATATGSAVDSLTTRIDTAEDTISSTSSSLLSLQSQVNSMDMGTGGYGAAISALDVRVTQNENSIDSMASDITALQSSATSANKIYAQATPPPTVGGTSGDLWFDTDDGNKPYTLTGGAWVPRQDLGKNSIFVQPTQPTAKAVNDLWIETDANNKLWRWNGTTWVDATDPRISANASAISSLTTRTTAAENALTAQAAQVTNLSSTLGGKNSTFVQGTAPSSVGRVLGDIWIDTSIGNTIKTWSGSAWVTRPDNNRNRVFVQANPPTASAVGDLWFDSNDNNKPYNWNGTTWVDITDQRTLANAAATTALTTRVSDVEGITAAQASSITELFVSLSNSGGDNLILNSSFEQGSVQWSPAHNGMSAFTATYVATALPIGAQALRLAGTANVAGNYLDPRVATTNRPKVIAGATYTLSSYIRGTATGTITLYIQWLSSTGTVISTVSLPNNAVNATTYSRYVLTAEAPAGAVAASIFPGRLFAAGAGAVFMEIDNIMFQEGETVSGYKLSGVETASAVQTLDARVTTVEGVNTSQATSLTALSTTVGNHTASISTQQTSINGLNAKWNLTLDVNGYITGVESINNGSQTEFNIRADKFKLTPSASGARTEFSNGNWRVYDESGVLRVAMGVGI